MKILSTIRELILEHVRGVLIILPFQEAPIDLSVGYISMYDIGSDQLYKNSENFSINEDGTYSNKITTTTVRRFQINHHMFSEPTGSTGLEILQDLVTYLGSSYANEEFYNRELTIQVVWDNVKVSTYYSDDYKKWVTMAHFYLDLIVDNSIELEDEPLENIKMEVTRFE